MGFQKNISFLFKSSNNNTVYTRTLSKKGDFTELHMNIFESVTILLIIRVSIQMFYKQITSFDRVLFIEINIEKTVKRIVE